MRSNRFAFAIRLLTVWLLVGVMGAPGTARTVPSSPAAMSLDVNQADIRDVLRLLATISGMNIIVSPDVQGTVTAKLTDVAWEHALNAILKLHGLIQERQGNVILVTPIEQVVARRQAEARARDAARQGEPHITHLVPVRYRDAEELRAAIEPHLGACASVTADRRTNTLILTGTPSCLRGR